MTKELNQFLLCLSPRPFKTLKGDNIVCGSPTAEEAFDFSSLFPVYSNPIHFSSAKSKFIPSLSVQAFGCVPFMYHDKYTYTVYL